MKKPIILNNKAQFLNQDLNLKVQIKIILAYNSHQKIKKRLYIIRKINQFYKSKIQKSVMNHRHHWVREDLKTRS